MEKGFLAGVWHGVSVLAQNEGAETSLHDEGGVRGVHAEECANMRRNRGVEEVRF